MAETEEEVEYAGGGSLPSITFTRSESLKTIAPAIVAAQKKLVNPPKDSKNPHFGNNFAGLGVTMDAAREALNPQDVAILTPPIASPDGYVGIAVMLLHKSGEFIRGEGFLPLERSNAQGAGSAITYARRYFVQAMLGMVGEDDDDGNAASVEHEAPKSKGVKQPASAPSKGLFRSR